MPRDSENLNRWMREYKKKHRAKINARHARWRQTVAGKASIAANKQNKRRKIKVLLREARDKPCVDCGLHLPPELMDLDHVFGPKTKPWNALCTIAEARREIAKCQVRCPICHRIRHYIERLEGQSPSGKKEVE